jgi:integrase
MSTKRGRPDTESSRITIIESTSVPGDCRKRKIIISYQLDNGEPVVGEIDEVAGKIGKNPRSLRKTVLRLEEKSRVARVLQKRWPKKQVTLAEVAVQCPPGKPIPETIARGLDASELKILEDAIAEFHIEKGTLTAARSALQRQFPGVKPEAVREATLPNNSGLLWLVEVDALQYELAIGNKAGEVQSLGRHGAAEAEAILRSYSSGERRMGRRISYSSYLAEFEQVRERMAAGTTDEDFSMGSVLAFRYSKIKDGKKRGDGSHGAQVEGLIDLLGDIPIVLVTGKERDAAIAEAVTRFETGIVDERGVSRIKSFKKYVMKIQNAFADAGPELGDAGAKVASFCTTLLKRLVEKEASLIAQGKLQRRDNHVPLRLAEVRRLAADIAAVDLVSFNSFFVFLSGGFRPEEAIRLEKNHLSASDKLDYSRRGGLITKPYRKFPDKKDLPSPEAPPLLSHLLRNCEINCLLLYQLLGGTPLNQLARQQDLMKVIQKSSIPRGTRGRMRKITGNEAIYPRRFRTTVGTFLRFSETSKRFRPINDLYITKLLSHATTKEIEDAYGRTDPLELCYQEAGVRQVGNQCDVLMDIAEELDIKFEEPITVAVNEKRLEFHKVNLLDVSMTAWDAFLVKLYCDTYREFVSAAEFKASLRKLCEEILVNKIRFEGEFGYEIKKRSYASV